MNSTRTLEEQQVLVPAESGVWQISDLSQIRVPKLVRHVIEGRLRRLSERTRELLQVGAVLGRSVPVDLWQQVTGADDPTLIFALEQGQTAHLLNESANGDIWQFNHSLIRETLYEDLVSMQRRSWHRVVAEALELTPNPDPDQTAYHYQQARDTRAIAWLIERPSERNTPMTGIPQWIALRLRSHFWQPESTIVCAAGYKSTWHDCFAAVTPNGAFATVRTRTTSPSSPMIVFFVPSHLGVRGHLSCFVVQHTGRR